MANSTKFGFFDSIFCARDVTSNLPDGYTIECIEEYFPVWPVGLHEGPFTICSYDTGEGVLCPKHLTNHNPARATGPGRTAAGIVCHDCKTVYALTCILPKHNDHKMLCTPRDGELTCPITGE